MNKAIYLHMNVLLHLLNNTVLQHSTKQFLRVAVVEDDATSLLIWIAHTHTQRRLQFGTAPPQLLAPSFPRQSPDVTSAPHDGQFGSETPRRGSFSARADQGQVACNRMEGAHLDLGFSQDMFS